MSARHSIPGHADLISDLRALGIAPGDGIFAHSSLRAIGTPVAGPRTVIEALIGAVGPSGLVAMPGFSEDAYDPAALRGLQLPRDVHDAIRQQVPGFDPERSSVAAMGAVAEMFRTWPGTRRSLHPTSSVLVWGADADAICADHPREGWATGPATPWGRLRTRPAMKIVLIGVGWNRCSALHAAESLARHRRLKMRRFKTGPGNAPWMEAPDVADDLDRLFPQVGAAFEATGQVRTGTLGEAEVRICGYDALLTFASAWIDDRNRRDGVAPCSGSGG